MTTTHATPTTTSTTSTHIKRPVLRLSTSRASTPYLRHWMCLASRSLNGATATSGLASKNGQTTFPTVSSTKVVLGMSWIRKFSFPLFPPYLSLLLVFLSVLLIFFVQFLSTNKTRTRRFDLSLPPCFLRPCVVGIGKTRKVFSFLPSLFILGGCTSV